MSDDPLAKWRRDAVEPAAPASLQETASSATANDYAYVAFDAADRQERVALRRASGLVREPSYAGLIELAHDGESGSIVILIFSFNLKVTIIGRNLQSLVTGLRMSKIQFVQEYDAKRWEKPKDESAPFVETITVTVKKVPDAVTEVETP